jgi:hypothetical protein
MSAIKGTSYNLSLLAVLIANALLFVAFAFGVDHLPAEWPEAFARLRNMLPAGLGLILVGVLNSQLSPNAKARIIFARWQHPLPGTRAFSELADGDPRIDVAALAQKFGPLPISPIDQNRIWYKLYKRVDSQPSVLGIHKDYLFFRDYGVGALAIFLTLSPASMWLASHWQPVALYAFILVLQMVLVMRAARERGVRLVTTVLAIAASAPDAG